MRDGEKIGSIGMRAERDQLHLDYCVRIGGGEWEDVVETVRLVHVPCRYGGERRYFLCPGQPGGAACGRRAGKLYASGRYFLCRHCFKLTYSSQCEDAGMRLRRKARKALRHLDGDTSDWISVQRPKGMWRVAEAREVCHRRTHPRQLFTDAELDPMQRNAVESKGLKSVGGAILCALVIGLVWFLVFGGWSTRCKPRSRRAQPRKRAEAVDQTPTTGEFYPPACRADGTGGKRAKNRTCYQLLTGYARFRPWHHPPSDLLPIFGARSYRC
jgi:hypothetical protein